MNKIWHLAMKDLKLLSRDRMGAFFIVVFPILMGLFFGLAMGGPSSGSSGSKMKLSVVDEDQTPISQRLAEKLGENDSIELIAESFDEAKNNVRLGNRTGLIRIPKGFGEHAGIMWQEPPVLDVGMDPSRTAESGMMEGFLMQAMGNIAGEEMMNMDRQMPLIEEQQKNLETQLANSPIQLAASKMFFGSLKQMMGSVNELNSLPDEGSNAGNDSQNSLANGMQLVKVNKLDVTRELDPNSIAGQVAKLRSPWDISFPQAMLWGVMACAAGFAISLVREKTMGTLPRLQVAPVGKMTLLLGKALACFLAIVVVIAMLTTLGVMLGMEPANYLMLGIVSVCVAVAFVGIMIAVSTLGKTEQGVSGAGWGINMIMAMIGGAMIPAMFMPKILLEASVISPVRWSIYGIEGAIWRGFSWMEVAMPCVILILVGVVGFALGVTIWMRRSLA